MRIYKASRKTVHANFILKTQNNVESSSLASTIDSSTENLCYARDDKFQAYALRVLLINKIDINRRKEPSLNIIRYVVI